MSETSTIDRAGIGDRGSDPHLAHRGARYVIPSIIRLCVPALFIFPVDPASLASRIAREDKNLTALIDGSEEEPDHQIDTSMLERVKGLIALLPPRERDIWELYHFGGKRQSDIASIFGITQAAASYTIARATQRLRFLVTLPRIDEQEVERLLRTTSLRPAAIAILMSYRKTSQQSLTASELRMTQGRVRHNLMQACGLLEEWAVTRPELRDVSKLFSALRDRPNILHRVEQPRFKGKGTQVVDDRFAARCRGESGAKP